MKGPPEAPAEEAELEQARREAAEALACAEGAMPDLSRGPALEMEREASLAIRTRQSASWDGGARLGQNEQALGETVQEAAQLKAAQAERDDEQARLQAEVPALEAHAQESDRAAARALTAAGDAAAALRETLQAGEPCPVCGATEHRLSAVGAVLGEAVEEARARASITAEALATARNRLTVLGVEGVGTRARLERLEHVRNEQEGLWERCQIACADAARQLAEALDAAGFQTDGAGEGLAEQIETRLSGIAK